MNHDSVTVWPVPHSKCFQNHKWGCWRLPLLCYFICIIIFHPKHRDLCEMTPCPNFKPHELSTCNLFSSTSRLQTTPARQHVLFNRMCVQVDLAVIFEISHPHCYGLELLSWKQAVRSSSTSLHLLFTSKQEVGPVGVSSGPYLLPVSA